MSWSRVFPRLGFLLLPLLLAGCASTTPLPSSSVPTIERSDLGGPAIPSPAEVLGFEVGADGKLASWSQIVDYFERLEGASPMIEVEEIGRTVEGRPLLLTVITAPSRSEEHTSELQSRGHLVCRLLLEKKKIRAQEQNTRK